MSWVPPPPSPRRGEPRGSEGQAKRSRPFGLQRGDASFPTKLEGGGSKDARPAPKPGAKGTGPCQGTAARLARRGRSESRAKEQRLQGLGAWRGLRVRPERFCAALRAPAGSLWSLLQTRATSLCAPGFTPSLGLGQGSPADPGTGGPMPAARQAGKLGSPSAGGEDKQAPAPGPAGRRGAAGAGTPAGRSGTGWWRRRLGTLPAPTQELRPRTCGGRGRGEDQLTGLGRAGRNAPWRRPSSASLGQSLWLLAGPGHAGGCRGCSSLSRRCPLLCHCCRGCPISAAGTGARDVTLRAPPAQSPPPVRAARGPRQVRGAAGRARGARGLPALPGPAVGEGRMCVPAPGSRGARQATVPSQPPTSQHAPPLFSSCLLPGPGSPRLCSQDAQLVLISGQGLWSPGGPVHHTTEAVPGRKVK